MFRKKIILLVAGFFLISLSVSVFAANEKKLSPEEEKALKTKIKALEKENPQVTIEANTIKVNVENLRFPEGIILAVTEDDVEMTFYAIRGETVVTKGKKNIALENNLNEGDEIEVAYYVNSEGKFIATKVDIIKEAGAE